VKVTNTTTNAVTMDVRCEAVGVPANYTYIRWDHTWPGHTSVLRSYPGSEVLRLHGLTYEYSGYYTCRVENGVKSSVNPGAGVGRAYLLVEGTLSSYFYNINSNVVLIFLTPDIISVLLKRDIYDVDIVRYTICI